MADSRRQRSLFAMGQCGGCRAGTREWRVLQGLETPDFAERQASPASARRLNPPKRSLRGASLSEVRTRTGSTRVDRGHDAVVVIAVDAIRRRWPGTKTVTAGYRWVFAHREAALIDAQLNEGDVSRNGSDIVTHDGFQVPGS